MRPRRNIRIWYFAQNPLSQWIQANEEIRNRYANNECCTVIQFNVCLPYWFNPYVETTTFSNSNQNDIDIFKIDWEREGWEQPAAEIDDLKEWEKESKIKRENDKCSIIVFHSQTKYSTTDFGINCLYVRSKIRMDLQMPWKLSIQRINRTDLRILNCCFSLFKHFVCYKLHICGLPTIFR